MHTEFAHGTFPQQVSFIFKLMITHLQIKYLWVS